MTKSISKDKKVIAVKVCRIVKLFIVRNEYSYINRNDIKEDIYTPDYLKKEQSQEAPLQHRWIDCGV